MLNPAGVMFGKNASLDLSGSFHVSTADYLRMGENERFHANLSEDSVLFAAAPNAFGFLDNDIAPITFEGGEIAHPEDENDAALLAVPEGETVSVIGGDIEMEGVFYQRQVTYYDENGNPIPVMEPVNLSDIKAPGGRIDMASVASNGEVIPTESDLNVTSSEKGNITIRDKASADFSGTGAEVFSSGEENLSLMTAGLMPQLWEKKTVARLIFRQRICHLKTALQFMQIPMEAAKAGM